MRLETADHALPVEREQAAEPVTSLLASALVAGSPAPIFSTSS
jgi:hypothetical protein